MHIIQFTYPPTTWVKVKIAVVSSLILYMLVPATSQLKNINIQILPINPDVISNYLIVASDEEGFPVYEKLLSKEELKIGSTHLITFDTSRMFHLSLVKEYFVDTINFGYSFIRATSYYNIRNDLVIPIEVEPLVCSPTSLSPVTIKVFDIEDVEDVFYYTKGNRYDRWRVKEDFLRIQLDHEKGENIFIVIKSNLDSDYKYLYIDDNNVEKFLTYSWHDLPSDLEEFMIDLPVEKDWNGTITTISPYNGAETMLFNRRGADDEIDNISFFFPLSKALGPTQINLSYKDQNTIDSPTYNYSINSEIPSSLPLFDSEIFQISNYNANKELVTFEMNDIPDAFQFSYLKNSIDFTKSQLPLPTMSIWTVIGHREPSINFNLPKITPSIKQQFLSLDDKFGNWWTNNRILLYKTLGPEAPSLSDLISDRCSMNLVSVYKHMLK